VGFKPPRKIYNLDFAGTDYDGAHVRMRGTTVREEMRINDLRASEDPSSVQGLFEAMVELLIDWDIEDDDGPVPTTLEGVTSQDSSFISAVITALQTAVAGVEAPLAGSSPSGELSPVVSIPMEPLSPSPESLPA
jgi:hypothetical protein